MDQKTREQAGDTTLEIQLLPHPSSQSLPPQFQKYHCPCAATDTAAGLLAEHRCPDAPWHVRTVGKSGETMKSLGTVMSATIRQAVMSQVVEVQSGAQRSINVHCRLLRRLSFRAHNSQCIVSSRQNSNVKLVALSVQPKQSRKSAADKEGAKTVTVGAATKKAPAPKKACSASFKHFLMQCCLRSLFTPATACELRPAPPK